MKESPDFPEFLQAVGECGLPYAPADLGLCRAIWAILDRDQKAAAVAGLYQRKECGEFDDAAYRPLPQNYLRTRSWTRPLRIKNSNVAMTRERVWGNQSAEEVVPVDGETASLILWAEARGYPLNNGAQLAAAEAAKKGESK